MAKHFENTAEIMKRFRDKMEKENARLTKEIADLEAISFRIDREQKELRNQELEYQRELFLLKTNFIDLQSQFKSDNDSSFLESLVIFADTINYIIYEGKEVAQIEKNLLVLECDFKCKEVQKQGVKETLSQRYLELQKVRLSYDAARGNLVQLIHAGRKHHYC